MQVSTSDKINEHFVVEVVGRGRPCRVLGPMPHNIALVTCAQMARDNKVPEAVINSDILNDRTEPGCWYETGDSAGVWLVSVTLPPTVLRADNYEELREGLRYLPLTWYPDLIRVLVETSVEKDVFRPGEIAGYVQHYETQATAAKAERKEGK